MTYKLIPLYVCAIAAMAQVTPIRPAPPVTEVKAAIGLTDAQVQQLQALRQQEHNEGQVLHEQVAAKQKALADLLAAGTTDASAVGRIVLDTQALRKQIAELRTRYRSQALQLLTAEQKTKLKTLEDALNLQPAVGQAIGLNLLTPPEHAAGAPGPGLGRPGFGGPGMGPGQMPMRRRAIQQ